MPPSRMEPPVRWTNWLILATLPAVVIVSWIAGRIQARRRLKGRFCRFCYSHLIYMDAFNCRLVCADCKKQDVLPRAYRERADSYRESRQSRLDSRRGRTVLTGLWVARPRAHRTSGGVVYSVPGGLWLRRLFWNRTMWQATLVSFSVIVTAVVLVYLNHKHMSIHTLRPSIFIGIMAYFAGKFILRYAFYMMRRGVRILVLRSFGTSASPQSRLLADVAGRFGRVVTLHDQSYGDVNHLGDSLGIYEIGEEVDDVLVASDATWRTSIAEELLCCDYVFVDYHRTSSNLAWELSAAFRLVPPQKIYLVCDQARREEVRNLLGVIREVLGRDERRTAVTLVSRDEHDDYAKKLFRVFRFDRRRGVDRNFAPTPLDMEAERRLLRKLHAELCAAALLPSTAEIDESGFARSTQKLGVRLVAESTSEYTPGREHV